MIKQSTVLDHVVSQKGFDKLLEDLPFSTDILTDLAAEGNYEKLGEIFGMGSNEATVCKKTPSRPKGKAAADKIGYTPRG